MKKPAILMCVVLLGAGAVVHGATTHRWSVLAPPASRSGQFHAHTVRLGDFQCEEVPNEIPLKEMSVGTTKKYTSPSRGLIVMTSLTSGPPGAVSTHTPDVCYPASGYRTVREATRETIDLPEGGRASYYVAEFEKKSATRSERQRVRWAWSSNGTWDAPDHPRFAYLRDSELYKLYVVTPVVESDAGRPAEDSPEVRKFVAATFTQYAGLFAGN
jgi:hypothetical protein